MERSAEIKKGHMQMPSRPWRLGESPAASLRGATSLLSVVTELRPSALTALRYHSYSEMGSASSLHYRQSPPSRPPTEAPSEPPIEAAWGVRRGCVSAAHGQRRGGSGRAIPIAIGPYQTPL